MKQRSAHWVRPVIGTGLLVLSAVLSTAMGGRGAAVEGYAEIAARHAEAGSPDVSALVRRAQILSLGLDQAHEALEERHERLLRTPSILPTRGTLSSAFTRSRWHPVLNRSRPHNGLDIGADRGAPILASAKGRVRSAGWSSGYGLTVEIDHGYGYVTRYAHASRLHVRKGERVERGQKIAEVGSTGLAEAPHLHYEVLIDGTPANPRRFIYGPPGRRND